VTDTRSHDPRLRRAAPWVAWASRTVLSLLFSLGMLGAGSRPLVEVEPEPTVEIGEDGQAAPREEQDARIVRRNVSHRRAWSTREAARVRAPMRLQPTTPPPTLPDWQRPRRAPPPADGDDDDTSLG
jgi:hypothetical protein